MAARGDRAGIDDRWHKRMRQPDGTTTTVKSAVYGQVTRWRVRWVVDGREHSKVFERKVDAQAHLDQVTADVVKGTYVSPHKSSVLLRDIAEEWIAGKGARKPKTVAGYRSILDTLILPRFGDTKLSDITHGDVQKWVSSLSVDGSIRTTGKGLSASRVIQAHQCLGAIIDYAMRTERVGKNVAKKIELPRKSVGEPRLYLTHGELQALAAAAGRFETMTLTLGYCGLRFGEAVALRGRDIQDGTITVRSSVTNVTGKGLIEDTTKTGRVRTVPVPGLVWDRLKNELPSDPDALVFPGNKEGEWLTTGQYRHVFDSAAKQAGVPGLTPHDLRHTCASLAISTGTNIKAIQRLLGHQTTAMTLDRYGHLFDDDLQRVAHQLDTAARAAQSSCGTTAVSETVDQAENSL
ncbi:tyrosine-type recombinase/integrase [Mycolicibacterium farcinogenes]|uniref:Site-specific integrase n=1 Tax=Mycolicibacterium farcinogenes TaxID=1802 RepID=A0ACD1F9T6_MYCFR|nr:site-specific integrase [Mycolicibacterium farcinogenes]QZH63801.1 site-specific integrase [Mycolicibacterium farcinogenes]